MRLNRRELLGAGISALAGAALKPARASAAPALRFRGVNLAGAEFGSAVPGMMHKDYIYPGNEHIDYFADKGMNLFRLPFRWERVQPRLNGGFDPEDITRIDLFVEHAAGRGAHVVLDPHNFGRREVDGTSLVIGETADLTSAHFADFWVRLALRYRGSPNVIFGLMNEPHDQDSTVLVSVLNDAIRAIRDAGATNLILVPGNDWTGAHSWVSSGNSTAMLLIRDPGMNFAFEVHQYLDRGSSGTGRTCTAGSGATRLDAFTNWARANGRKGFLGEFAVTANEPCAQELDDLLSAVAANSDVWLGWAYWAAGPWWGEEPFTIAPADIANPVDRPQMEILERFL